MVPGELVHTVLPRQHAEYTASYKSLSIQMYINIFSIQPQTLLYWDFLQ